MKKMLVGAIENNAKLASASDIKPDEAMKYTQAALNAANTLRSVIESENREENVVEVRNIESVEELRKWLRPLPDDQILHVDIKVDDKGELK